jgi:hypothetical protein
MHCVALLSRLATDRFIVPLLLLLPLLSLFPCFSQLRANGKAVAEPPSGGSTTIGWKTCTWSGRVHGKTSCERESSVEMVSLPHSHTHTLSLTLTQRKGAGKREVMEQNMDANFSPISTIDRKTENKNAFPRPVKRRGRRRRGRRTDMINNMERSTGSSKKRKKEISSPTFPPPMAQRTGPLSYRWISHRRSLRGLALSS